MSERHLDDPAPEEREEGMQNPIDDVGAAPDPNYDGNERADDRVRIEEPDGGESPRADD